MLESMSNTLARVEEIKSQFRAVRANGAVGIAPHYSSGEALSGASFDNYLQPASKTPVTKTAGMTETISKYDDIIEKASAKYGVDSSLVKAVIQAESGFRKDALSSAGAMGLMQLMPKTASGFGLSDPFDPEQNIDAGTHYLKGQLDRFDGDEELALAAYNAGPGNVIKYGKKIPPFKQTQDYVQKVMENRENFK